MALMESGQVYSWGFNDYGQLGLGSKTDKQVRFQCEMATNNDLPAMQRIPFFYG